LRNTFTRNSVARQVPQANLVFSILLSELSEGIQGAIVPIRREQFEQTLDDSQMRILQFLGQNPDEAFTFRELSQSLGYSLTPASPGQGIDLGAVVIDAFRLWGLSSTLDSLARRHKLAVKTIGGEHYYAAHTTLAKG
jgi:hypothetical protein